jgi:hypothetical protein
MEKKKRRNKLAIEKNSRASIPFDTPPLPPPPLPPQLQNNSPIDGLQQSLK